MSEDRGALEAAVAALEAQRNALGDAVVDLAVAPLLARLAGGATRVASADEPRLVHATVLFVDTVESTALGERLDAEDMHAVMNHVASRFTDSVHAHKGRVVKYTGDGLLAAFGIDEAQEHGAENAVRAGLAMVRAIAGLSSDLAVESPIGELAVRVGIHTGPLVIGGGIEAASNIRGATVNLAARMEQHAPAGGLRMSHDTYRHVRGLFDVIDQSPIAVKGLDGPVRSYLVVRARQHTFDGPTRGVDGIETPMVGRRAELDVLKRSFDSVASERTFRAHLIVGEAGVGKSRLLHEFRKWAGTRSNAVHVLAGRAQAGTRQEPYGLLRDAFTSWVGSDRADDDPSARRERFAAQVRPYLPDEAAAHVLGHLVGLDFSASRHIAGIRDDQKQLHGRGVRAADEFLRGLAADPERGAPVLLFLEDLHWADDATLDLVGHLARVNVDVPILVVATTRPELLDRRQELGRPGGTMSTSTLRALDADQADELVGQLLARFDVVPPDLRNLVATSGDGIPFFMEEVVEMLLDDGTIVVEHGGTWRLGIGRLEATRVPTTLGGVLQARLDALDEDQRDAAQCASVIGHLFWDEAVSALGADAPAIEGLTNRGFIVAHATSSMPGCRERSFRHHLLHQFTYQSIPKRERRLHHAAAADWLEAAAADRPVEHLAAVGEHHERAGSAAEAARCYAEAARQAADRNSGAVAIDLVDRAFRLVTDADEDARWQLLLIREQVLSLGDDRERHDADLAVLEALAESTGDDVRRAEAALRRAGALMLQGEYPQAATAARCAVERAEAAGDTERLAHSYRLVATTMWRMGDLSGALEMAERSLTAARSVDAGRAEAAALRLLATVRTEAGEHAAADLAISESLDICRAIGDRIGEAGAFNHLGCASLDVGALGAARQSFASTRHLARETGWTYGESLALLNLGELDLLEGDHQAALAHSRAGADIAAVSGARDLEAAALVIVGYAVIGLGRLDEARSAFNRSRELFELNSSPHYALGPTVGLAMVHHLEHDDRGAVALVGAVVDHIDGGGTLAGIDCRMATFLNSYTVLAAAGDPRARHVLAAAATALTNEADRFDEPERRLQYLHGAPDHRAVMEQWTALTSTSK